jgi:hypothetical protein
VDCASLLANGEVFASNGDDITAEHDARMTAQGWGYPDSITLGCAECPPLDTEAYELHAEPWFSSYDCHGCGSQLGGDRYCATGWL